MIIFAAALVLAAVLGWGIIRADRKRPAPDGPAPSPTMPGWAALIFGAIGLVALAIPLAMSVVAPQVEEGSALNLPLLPLASMAFALTGSVVGMYALYRHDRHWPTWVGLGLSGISVGFWLFFLVASALYGV